jgi:hypothetical protein
MYQLHFDFRDIFRAPRFALSVQKMWTQFLGLSVGYLCYLVLTYASMLISGYKLADMWIRYGLLPCLFATGDLYPWFAWLVSSIGSLLFLASLLIAKTAVARAVYMQAKGNNFYTYHEAYKFAFRKMWSVLLAPISLFVLVGFMIIGFLFVSLLGKIPFIGEIGISLFTFIWFVLTLLLFFILIVIGVSFLLVPSIIATTDDDAFEAIFQAFSTTWKQPWRFLLYEAMTLVLSIISLGILAAFAKESISIMNTLFGSFMGSDFINLANNGQGLVQGWLLMGQNIVDSTFQLFSQFVYFKNEFIIIPASKLSVSVVISSYLYAISLLFIGGWILSYGLATFSSGNTMLFLAIKMKKDNVNLLARKDQEEQENKEPDNANEQNSQKN